MRAVGEVSVHAAAQPAARAPAWLRAYLMPLPPVQSRPPACTSERSRKRHRPDSKDSGPGTTLVAEALLVPNTTLFPPRPPYSRICSDEVEPAQLTYHNPAHEGGARPGRSSDWFPPLNFRTRFRRPLVRILTSLPGDALRFLGVVVATHVLEPEL